MILRCTPTRTGKLCFNLLDCNTLKLKYSNIHDVNCSDLRLKIISIKGHAFLFTINYTSNVRVLCQNANLVEIPYLGKEYSMWVFLPNKRFGLDKNLTVKKMKYMVEQGKEVQGYLQLELPKFKLEYEKNLRETFEEFGMMDMFLFQSTNFK